MNTYYGIPVDFLKSIFWEKLRIHFFTMITAQKNACSSLIRFNL